MIIRQLVLRGAPFLLVASSVLGQSSAEILLNRMFQGSSPAVAERQLEEQGRSDSATYQLLSAKLPMLLLKTKDLKILTLLAKLAGDLKLISTVPSLNHLLSDDRSKPLVMTTFYEEAELINDPIGSALAHIGEAAVPAVSESLEVPSARPRALHVLAKIGGPKAVKALQRALDNEGDQNMRPFIQACIKRASEAQAPKPR